MSDSVWTEQYLAGHAHPGTLKGVAYEELPHLGCVVKKSLEAYGSPWDMTVPGLLMLGVACKGNIGMGLYMLDRIAPKPGQLVDTDDIVEAFPFGFSGDWDAEWDDFKARSPDQRTVFHPTTASHS